MTNDCKKLLLKNTTKQKGLANCKTLLFLSIIHHLSSVVLSPIYLHYPPLSSCHPSSTNCHLSYCPCARLYAFLSPSFSNSSDEVILKSPLRLTYRPSTSCWFSGRSSRLSNRALYRLTKLV